VYVRVAKLARFDVVRTTRKKEDDSGGPVVDGPHSSKCVAARWLADEDK
jgi:hypothetical protein